MRSQNCCKLVIRSSQTSEICGDAQAVMLCGLWAWIIAASIVCLPSSLDSCVYPDDFLLNRNQQSGGEGRSSTGTSIALLQGAVTWLVCTASCHNVHNTKTLVCCA